MDQNGNSSEQETIATHKRFVERLLFELFPGALDPTWESPRADYLYRLYFTWESRHYVAYFPVDHLDSEETEQQLEQDLLGAEPIASERPRTQC